MKTSMKKLGTVLLTVALLISALGGFVYAADGNYVSLHVEKTSDTEVTVTVKTIQPIDDILSLNAKFTVPDGFSFGREIPGPPGEAGRLFDCVNRTVIPNG